MWGIIVRGFWIQWTGSSVYVEICWTGFLQLPDICYDPAMTFEDCTVGKQKRRGGERKNQIKKRKFPIKSLCEKKKKIEGEVFWWRQSEIHGSVAGNRGRPCVSSVFEGVWPVFKMLEGKKIIRWRTVNSELLAKGRGRGEKKQTSTLFILFFGEEQEPSPPPARSFTVRFFRFYVFFHRPTSQRTKTKEATTCSGGTTQRLGKHSPSPRRCGDKAGQWTLQEYIHHHQISALVPAQKPTQHVGKPFRVRQARRIGPRLFTLKKGIIKFYFHGRKFFFPLPWSFF